MSLTTEKLILSNLVSNREFVHKVLPYLKKEYFDDSVERKLFDIIEHYLKTYNNLPNKTTLLIEVSDCEWTEPDEVNDYVKNLYTIDSPSDEKWLIEQAEEFCQNKAIYNAIIKAISIYDGSDTLTPTHAIPDMVKDAVAITFNTTVGLDFNDDAELRYDYYTSSEEKIPFDIGMMNTITNGGISRKTLNLIVSGVNVGKTMTLCHLASAYTRYGFNVLYITLEMREEEILKRVDANLLDISLDNFYKLEKDKFLSKFDELKHKSYGKLKVKEFAAGTANASRIGSVMNELKMKQNFNCDVLIVDYLGIAASDRLKAGAHNTYSYLKSVSEEIRALAVDNNIAVFSAAQFNRSGASDTDADMTDIADSMGISHSADLMLSLTRTEELDDAKQIMVKQLKNRYGDKTANLRFTLGVDLMHQRLMDVEGGGPVGPITKQERQVERKEESVSTKLKTNDLKKKFDILN